MGSISCCSKHTLVFLSTAVNRRGAVSTKHTMTGGPTAQGVCLSAQQLEGNKLLHAEVLQQLPCDQEMLYLWRSAQEFSLSNEAT